jgi:peptidoglycan/xylan/chitin deacetylase (PgdA/CDA1 family)
MIRGPGEGVAALRRSVGWPAVAFAAVLAAALTPFAARAGVPAGMPIARLHTTEKVIALSFDDGPQATSVLDTLLAVLASRHAHATFFVIGDELVRVPGAGRRLLAAGQELGNHSWTHPHLDSIGVDSMRIELARTDSLLHALGAKGRILLRPPYGAFDERMMQALRHDKRTVALFDVDPSYDFPWTTNPDSVEAKTVEWLGPGSILVMHPWYEHGDETARMLPVVLDWLERLGYRIVTVSELFRLRHATPEVSLYHRPE